MHPVDPMQQRIVAGGMTRRIIRRLHARSPAESGVASQAMTG
jgi:hypothetical protein